MSETEFLLVAFSIMISLAFAKLLQGLVWGSICAGWYGVHLAWTTHRLMGALLYFWAFKILLDLPENFTFFQYISIIFSPMLFYAQALLLCSEQPDAVKDWKSHFHKIRRPFFILYLAIMLGNINLIIVFDIPFPLIGFVVQIVSGVMGILFLNEYVHKILVSVNLLALGIGVALPLLRLA
jgi:hypothetical protein